MSRTYSDRQLPLFVYGTLRKGKCNHHFLHGKYTRMVAARLPGFVKIHPIMVKQHPTSHVDGELYFIRSEIYQAVIEACDMLEELYPGEMHGPDYKRMALPVLAPEGEIQAWAYVHRETQLHRETQPRPADASQANRPSSSSDAR